MTLYVVMMICSISLPCDEHHARAYRALKAEPGQIVCGLPSTSAALVETGLRPADGEYLVVKCKAAR